MRPTFSRCASSKLVQTDLFCEFFESIYIDKRALVRRIKTNHNHNYSVCHLSKFAIRWTSEKESPWNALSCSWLLALSYFATNCFENVTQFPVRQGKWKKGLFVVFWLTISTSYLVSVISVIKRIRLRVVHVCKEGRKLSNRHLNISHLTHPSLHSPFLLHFRRWQW